MLSFYLGLLIPVLGFIVALYQIPKDMHVPKSKSDGKNKWNSLTSKGKRYVTLSFLVAVIVEAGLIIKGPEKPNPVQEPIVKEKLVYVPTIVKQKDTVKETVKLNNNIDPVMDITDDSTKYVGNLGASMGIQFDFITVNNGIAYNPKVTSLLFALIDGNIKSIGKPQYASNTTLKSYLKKSYSYTMGVKLPNVFRADTTYIYFKALYSNKETGGKYQPALRRIYFTVLNENPKDIKDLKIQPVIDTRMHEKLKLLLIQNKYW
jgi:hypothetical protein